MTTPEDRRLRREDESWPAIRARARRRDPVTSHAAAASVAGITEKQRAVLRVLAWAGPLTDEELVEEYERPRVEPLPEQSPSGIRSRRSELVKLGHVEAVGQGRTGAGRRALRWAATGMGVFG